MERRPFLRRPFLHCEDGRWILLFPRAIESWLGGGLRYRALDAAAVKGETPRYNNFFGHLVERYCLDLAERVSPLDRPLGSGRAHPGQPWAVAAVVAPSTSRSTSVPTCSRLKSLPRA